MVNRWITLECFEKEYYMIFKTINERIATMFYKGYKHEPSEHLLGQVAGYVIEDSWMNSSEENVAITHTHGAPEN